ncbi:MAG TPA: hypothetical protein VN837_04195 [Chloroflexota bacterium]|nr:hypothetical protein [Chloroflexota bacterium]
MGNPSDAGRSGDRYAIRIAIPRDLGENAAAIAGREAVARAALAARGFPVVTTRRSRDDRGILWIEMEGESSVTPPREEG